MWTCQCGEQIEDQFDACWKCAAKAVDQPKKPGIEASLVKNYSPQKTGMAKTPESIFADVPKDRITLSQKDLDRLEGTIIQKFLSLPTGTSIAVADLIAQGAKTAKITLSKSDSKVLKIAVTEFVEEFLRKSEVRKPVAESATGKHVVKGAGAVFRNQTVAIAPDCIQIFKKSGKIEASIALPKAGVVCCEYYELRRPGTTTRKLILSVRDADGRVVPFSNGSSPCHVEDFTHQNAVELAENIAKLRPGLLVVNTTLDESEAEKLLSSSSGTWKCPHCEGINSTSKLVWKLQQARLAHTMIVGLVPPIEVFCTHCNAVVQTEDLLPAYRSKVSFGEYFAFIASLVIAFSVGREYGFWAGFGTFVGVMGIAMMIFGALYRREMTPRIECEMTYRVPREGNSASRSKLRITVETVH